MADTLNKTLEKLKELLELPKEKEYVEFKASFYTPELIGAYISALSNSACLNNEAHGYLIFGVENKTHKVIGTKFKPSTRKVGNEELENWLSSQLDPRIDFRFFEFTHLNESIVMFQIDAAKLRPVKFKGIAHIRIGTYMKKLSQHPEKERKIWIKSQTMEFEEEAALNEVAADDVLALLDYSAHFELMRLKLPTNKDLIIQKLLEEKLIIEEMRGYYNITNLGAILFAKDLRRFRNLGRKAVRVIIYEGKNRLKTIKEQEGRRGYAGGFKGLIDYINDQLPVNEEIGKAFRKVVKMYPKIAIRELVANALIHQDFREKGTGPMVEIFKDRVEICNPGKPLISTLRFIDHNPMSRNEKLAAFLRRINVCEERGSGIDKVVASTAIYQLPAPDFIADDNFLRVILYAHKSIRQMDKRDKTRTCYQHCCLKYVTNELMTNQSLRERLKIPAKNYSIVSRIIADTIKGGLIKDYDPSSGSRKYAKYIPFWA